MIITALLEAQLWIELISGVLQGAVGKLYYDTATTKFMVAESRLITKLIHQVDVSGLRMFSRI